MDLQALGRNIRTARQAAKLTQEEMAARAEISNRTLQRVESGDENFKIGTLAAIANVLTVSVTDLLPSEASARSSKIPTFGSAAEFLSRFEDLPPMLQRLILGLVYQDASYGKGIKLTPELLASVQAMLGPLPKAR